MPSTDSSVRRGASFWQLFAGARARVGAVASCDRTGLRNAAMLPDCEPPPIGKGFAIRWSFPSLTYGNRFVFARPKAKSRRSVGTAP